MNAMNRRQSEDDIAITSVSAAELNRRFGEIRRAVRDGVVTVTHHGTPTLALLSIERFQQLTTSEASPELAAAWRRKLQLILDDVREGYISVDRDFRVRSVNRFAEMFIGRAREELIGLRLDEAFSSIRSELHTFREVMERGEIQRYARASALHPERQIAITVMPLPDAIGGVGILFANITEQTRMSETLVEQDATINALLEVVTDRIIFSVNPGGAIELWGAGAARLLGWDAGEIVGMPLATVVVGSIETATGAGFELRRRDGAAVKASGTVERLSKTADVSLYVLTPAS